MTIFAYGQTSTGKTFTMRGVSPHNEGVIPHSIKEIFSLIEGTECVKSTVKVSYVEIYNEAINDLLDTSKKNLELREGMNKEVFVNNLTEVKVSNSNEVMNLLQKGEDNRIVAETKLNEKSSRSHSVFRINIEITKKVNEKTTTFISQLNLIDLAGSENASKTCCVGLRFKEGANINKSLLALSNVINSLSQKQFVNYRDSKLTRLLQPALGGNSKTAIICTITDDVGHYSETMNTLLFGLKAKNVKTFVKVNEVKEGNKFQIENELLKNKVKELEYLIKTQQKMTVSKENVIHKVEFSISKVQNEYCVTRENKEETINHSPCKSSIEDKSESDCEESPKSKQSDESSTLDKKKTKTVLNTLEKEISLLRSFLMNQKEKEDDNNNDNMSIESEEICRNLMMSSRKPNFKLGLTSAKKTEAKYKELLVENEEMRQSITEQENQYKEVLKNKDNDIQSLEKNKAIALQNYMKMLKESEENYNNLMCTYDKAKKDLEDKEEEVKTLYEDNINKQADINNLKNRLSSLENKECSELLEHLEKENEKINEKNKELRDSLDKAYEDMNELKKANEELRRENENLKRRCETLNNDLTSSRAQNEFINKVHSLLKLDNSKLKNEIESYKNEIEALKKQKKKVTTSSSTASLVNRVEFKDITKKESNITSKNDFLNKKRKVIYSSSSTISIKQKNKKEN